MKANQYEWTDLPTAYAIKSHGHIAVRPDGCLARCSGPGLCSECELERFYLQLLANYRRATAAPQMVAALELALDIIQTIGGDRHFWATTQQATVRKVADMILERQAVK